jgi:hypothetical protein
MVMGAAQITGWRDFYDNAKDKMDYQVIVKQGGVEAVRMQTTQGFDAIVKRATMHKAEPAAKDGAEDAAAEKPASATLTPRATPITARDASPAHNASPHVPHRCQHAMSLWRRRSMAVLSSSSGLRKRRALPLPSSA